VAASTQESVAPPAPTGGQATNRRLDIQGLRAIAVLTVVAFHAGFPVPGGFVGVDVFFVISGFVITAMLHREWTAHGRIRFGRFYLRRFKRLTPALAVMVAVTAAISVLVLSPLGPQQTAAKTALGAIFLSANLVIASVTGDYFDAPAETNPLLNTWSLSVEEQFYLVFPAVLALCWILARRTRRHRNASVIVVTAIAAVSFGLACLNAAGQLGSRSEYLIGFYGPLSRAWEFAVGAVLALATTRFMVTTRRHSAMLGAAGAATLGSSLWLISGTTPFPGPWTLVPIAGTLLLIVAGTRSSPEDTGIVTRALAVKPMVKIGDWSYSLYLWHWPLIVFAKLLWPQTEWAPFAAAVVSFAPALASYRWVEQPIRNLQRETRSGRAILVTAVVVPPMLIAAAVGLAASKYWTPKYESGDVAVAHQGDIGHSGFHKFLNAHYTVCTAPELRDLALTFEGITRCHQSTPNPRIDVAIIGDSHAEHLFLGLAEALPQQNIAYYIVDGLPVRADAHFARILDHVAADPTVKTVLLDAYWGGRGVPQEALAETLATLAQSGKAVFVTDDVPDFRFDPFVCKYRKALFLPAQCSQAASDFMGRYSGYYPLLVNSVAAVPGAQLIATVPYFCTNDRCAMTRDDRLLYRDSTHLNMVGSRFLARRMLDDNPGFKAAVAQQTPT
jgi:peptidoglycan/LPS O-acetylase OafA/YrhL